MGGRQPERKRYDGMKEKCSIPGGKFKTLKLQRVALLAGPAVGSESEESTAGPASSATQQVLKLPLLCFMLNSISIGCLAGCIACHLLPPPIENH